MKAAPFIDSKLIKPSKASIQKQAKLDRQKNINLMGTPTILWFLYKRHETEILYIAVVLMFGLMFFRKIGVI